MKLTDKDLVAIIRSHRDDSLGVEDSDLSNDRAKAMDHYHGRPYGNEVDGRSQVVSRDLAEAVDWAMPGIMRVFTQSGSIAEFDPIGPEDEQLSQQESDYVNQVVMRDNNGFMVLHDAIKDTLLLKNGYVKHFWDETEKVSNEEYSGLSLEQVSKLLEDLQNDGSEVEITGQESKFIDIPGMEPQNPAMQIMQGPAQIEIFDIELKIKRKCSKCIVLAVPTEEVRVSKKCRGSLQTSPFTEHVTKKTRSELIEMGMSRSFVDELPAWNERQQSSQTTARDSVKDENTELGTSVGDRSMDEIEFCEAYIRVDFDGDGVAELRKVVTVANQIPPGEEWNEPIEAVPLTGFIAKRVPHRHVGESLDDELNDLQQIKTTLTRQLLDNIYFINNSETIVNDRANLKDFLTSTPGGIKRVKGSDPIADSVQALVKEPILDKILPVVDYFDRVKESRTGLTKASTGLDPDILKESTKGAFMENLNRASQKIEMITRLLAESGVREMILQVHGILCRHQDKSRMVQLRGKWVNVNPQEWQERTDLTVKVGLGTGNAEEKRQKLLLVSNLQDKLMQQFGMVGPEQAYSLFEDVSKTLGFDTPEKYVMSPKSPEFQQMMEHKKNQPPLPVLIEQVKAQSEQQTAQMRLQQEGQLERERMQMQAQVDQHRQEVEAQQQAAKMQMEKELAMFKAQLADQLERDRMAMKAQVDTFIAKMNNEAKIDSAQVTAQTTLSAQQEAASDNAVGDQGETE